MTEDRQAQETRRIYLEQRRQQLAEAERMRVQIAAERDARRAQQA